MIAQVIWQGREWGVIAIAIGVVVAALVVWLYAGQVRRVRGVWRWVLPGLRGLALVAVVACFVQPAVVGEWGDGRRDAVVVLVDRSRSMSVVDARSEAELVALAAGLERLPEGARVEVMPGALARLQEIEGLAREVVQAQAAVDFARLAGRGVEEAEERAREAMERLRGAGAGLGEAARGGAAGFPSEGEGDLGMEEASGGAAGHTHVGEVESVLGGFVKIPEYSGREGWWREMERRLREARRVLGEAQALVDERLYEADGDVRRVCEELRELSRLELVGEALGHPQRGLLGRLSGAPVYLFGVGEDVKGMDLTGGRSPAAEPLGSRMEFGGTRRMPTEVRVGFDFEADGHRSDLIGAIDRVMERMKGRDVQGVVLFSDGRLVGGERTVPSALGASAVPVYTVSPVPAWGVLDLVVDSVTLPGSVFGGETLTVGATIRAVGIRERGAARSVGVHPPPAPPSREGGEVVEVYVEAEGERHVKQFVLEEGIVRVEFPLVLREHGAQRLRIGVEGVAGEISYENNEVERWVKVLSERLRVALLGGTPGWDYQYLKNALSRAAWVELREGMMDRAGGGRESAPLTPQQILQQDVVILNDVSVRAMSEAHWDAVHKLVTERGGSVIMVAGDAHLPREYVQHLLLSDLLPWRGGTVPQWRVWPGEQAVFRLVPSAEGMGVEALRLGEGSAGLQRWQHLPAMYRYMPAPELRANVRALLVERESGSAVLTEGRVGLGRVFFLGANETWRWRRGVGERDQERFWLQLIRHAAEAPYLVRSPHPVPVPEYLEREDSPSPSPSLEGRGAMALDVDRLRVEPGERVRVRARVWDYGGAPSGAPEQVLRVVRVGGGSGEEEAMPQAAGERVVRLGVVGPEGSGRYEGEVEGLPVGVYELELVSVEDSGSTVLDPGGDAAEPLVSEDDRGGSVPPSPSPSLGGRGVRVRIEVAVSFEEEMRDLSGDAELLGRIAEVSEGVFLPMYQLGRLPELLEERWEARSRRREYPLWSSPWVFLLVLSCLGAEWALRKRLGLA